MPKKKSTITLAVLIYAAFISTFNETVLNVALLAIAESFKVPLSAAQWLITGYMLVSAVMVPVTAFLYLSIPTKRLYLITILIIFIGSIGCLVSVPLKSFVIMLFFRLFQAIGTGMMFPILMNTTMIIMPREKLGSAVALCVCATSVGPAFAPTVAGIIIQNMHWSMIFVLIAVLSAAAIVLGVFSVENTAKLTHPKLDVLSVILSTAGLGSFLYGLTNVTSDPLMGLLFLGVGIIIILIFAKRQRKLSEPMLNLVPLGNSSFIKGMVLVLAAMMINFAIGAYMPTFLQGTGVSSSMSALVLMPGILLNVLTTNIIGKVVDKKGTKNILAIGFFTMTVGLLLIAAFGTENYMIMIVLEYIVFSQGVAFCMPSGQTAALSTLPPELNAHGIGILNTSLLVSGSLGSALYSGIESSVKSNLINKGISESLALASGFKMAVLVSVVVTIAGFILTMTMPKAKK